MPGDILPPMSVRVRFAPSPTGHLHVGNVRTALYNWLFARQNQGAFILRIDNTDLERSEANHEIQLIDDLNWLNLDWDEGPDSGGNCGPYRQSERRSLYQPYTDQLLEKNCAYYCFCSTAQLEEDRLRLEKAGRQPYYSGRCRQLDPEDVSRRLSQGERPTVRLKVRPGPIEFTDRVFGRLRVEADTIGDFILVRSSGVAQYNYACVLDDFLMQITDVIRGEGHISNTHRQLLIYESLGWQPPRFAHLSTILGPDGGKLSKRHGATSMDEFREDGYLPESMINYLAMLGWTPPQGEAEILNVSQLLRLFDLSKVNRSPATFDLEKLNWVNRGHLKSCSREQLAQLALPFLARAGLVPEPPDEPVWAWIQELVELFVAYLDRLADLPAAAAVVFDSGLKKLPADEEATSLLAEPAARAVIQATASHLFESPAEIDTDSGLYPELVKRVQERSGQLGKQLYRPLRLTLTGHLSGPQLERLIPLIERGRQLELPARVAGIKERAERVLALLQEVAARDA
jgi:glutamyl-tRNA synthetase